MAFDVTQLTNYTDENKLPLVKKMLLSPRTLQIVDVIPGIKSSATLNDVASEITATLGGACGFDPQSNTIFSQREISVCPIKVEEALCPEVLESYYLQKSMKAGSYQDSIPFEGIWSEERAEQIARLNDQLIWNGDTDNGVGNMALCDGFRKLTDDLILESPQEIIEANQGTASAIDATNVIDVLETQVRQVIPTNILSANDLVAFVGYDTYMTYIKALKDNNMFHIDPRESDGMEYSTNIYGTNVRVIAVEPLNGTNEVYASSASNFKVGVDLLSDYENFTLAYDVARDDIIFRSKWKMGVQVHYPEYMVVWKPA